MSFIDGVFNKELITLNIIYYFLFVGLLLVNVQQAFALPLTQVIKKVKPSVVGIGTYTPIAQPKSSLLGTGFAVGDGQYIVTNDHVIPQVLEEGINQRIVVFIGTGNNVELQGATVIDRNKDHDLALLKIEGDKLPAMKLADKSYLDEGAPIAFTGFPIGAVLGVYPVTHQGIVSAVTPIIIPVDNSKKISIKALKRLRNPYMVYQLDAVAYPGNSGSALYNANTGDVVGVINKVFVQSTKEAIISTPSGITYAIPVKYVHELLESNNIK